MLGATLANIIMLVSKEFIQLITIATFIAIPIAWFAGDKWLQNFAYRTPLQWWIFIVGGLITVLITIVTVSYHAIKAALANPVKSLRTE